MERTSSSSSPTNKDKGGKLSCWGRFKLKLPWNKGRTDYVSGSNNTRRGNSTSMQHGCNLIEALTRSGRRQARPAGGFRYDPLSYAQNFDDGSWDDDDFEVGLYRGFSSRLAASSSSRPINEDK